LPLTDNLVEKGFDLPRVTRAEANCNGLPLRVTNAELAFNEVILRDLPLIATELDVIFFACRDCMTEFITSVLSSLFCSIKASRIAPHILTF
jgi:hypothetical protein